MSAWSALSPGTKRRSIVAALVTVAVAGAVPETGLAATERHGGGCPPAESLVPGTTWHHHTLAKGVRLQAGVAKDSRGTVNIHVLRVDLTKPRVHVVPLERKVANRSPLSSLAQGHPQLVAATNTGYFDFDTGAPTVPLIVAGRAQVLSAHHQTVVGVGKDGRIEAGQVWLGSNVSAGRSTQPLSSLNEPFPSTGVSLYNAQWGTTRAPGSWSSLSRDVVHGQVVAGSLPSRGATVPANGYLLQARGRSAIGWLRGLSAGTKVSVGPTVKTNAASPFVQAYGVGVQLVSRPGVAKAGFSCDSSRTKTPARTAIGWTNGGRTMIMAIVAEHPHTSMHGLDQDQMSKLMVQLGASRAYSFDGSGSTELLAKLKSSSRLALQNYPADGAERPMPVGLGIAVAPAPHHHSKRHHKHH